MSAMTCAAACNAWPSPVFWLKT